MTYIQCQVFQSQYFCSETKAIFVFRDEVPYLKTPLFPNNLGQNRQNRKEVSHVLNNMDFVDDLCKVSKPQPRNSIVIPHPN